MARSKPRKVAAKPGKLRPTLVGTVQRDQGKFRIQSVAEMTQVPAATLRAWERRYGIPSPLRTASAYRLYSDSDVDKIRRLRELIDAGVAPAEAAREILRDIDEAPPPELAADGYEAAQAELLEAVERFDPDRLEEAVRRVLFLGSSTAIFERVLAPVMRTIGDKWHRGELSVAQEHFASELIGGVVRDMLRLVQPEESDKRALLACFADEEHVLPVFGVAFRLAEWGYRTTVLGARTPPSALGHAVESLRPDLVGLSVTVAPPLHRSRELSGEYARACNGSPWLIGGRGIETMRDLSVQEGGLVIDSPDLADLRVKIDELVIRNERRRNR